MGATESKVPELFIWSIGREPPLDSITVSVFADIFYELTNTDGKIQITILILRRGALSNVYSPATQPSLQNPVDFIIVGQTHLCPLQSKFRGGGRVVVHLK